jgi:hypothetical protein
MPTDDDRRPGHEPRDLSARMIGLVALGMVVAALAMHLGLALLQARFQEAGGKGAPIRGTPPIWVGEQGLKEGYLARRSRQLASYAWVDRRAGIVQLPIDRAMALVAQRGIRWDLASPPPQARFQQPPASAPASRPPRRSAP